MTTAPNGIDLIREEQERQIMEEGWTKEHDDSHSPGALALAGSCYAEAAAMRLAPIAFRPDVEEIPENWPWEPQWWKPKNTLRDLVRAGALIAAELDKMIAAGREG